MHNATASESANETCSHYARTGHCWYGAWCKFKHAKTDSQTKGKEEGEKKEHHTGDDEGDTAKEVCRNYARWGQCPYGAHCKYEHTTGEGKGASSKGICRHYARAGQCWYGKSCQFRH